MALGYRAFFNVNGSGDLLRLVDEQTYAWLTSKRWRFDALVEGAVSDLAPDTRGIVLSEANADGTRTKRYRFIQGSADSQWITELTAHAERDSSKGWVWLEIDQPEGVRTGNPRLASMLVEVLGVSDGRHLLTPRPLPVGVDDVESVIDSVLDPTRQGLLFLAGSKAGSEIPLQQWTTYVSGILKETVGLSSAYVLDADATAEFNQAVPDSHALREYTIRTYRPEVRIDDAVDGQRHRVLSTRSIVDDHPRYLQRLLGNRAREVVLNGTLPNGVRRLDRRLRDQLDAVVAGGPAEQLSDTPPGVEDVPTEQHGGAGRFASLVSSIVAQVLGETNVTEGALRRLGQLALDAKAAIASSRDVKQRLQTLENRVDSADDTIRALRLRLEDEQLESAMAASELAESDRQLRYLRAELASTGRAEIAWTTPGKDIRDELPESFDELLNRMSEFEYVEFTGDERPVRDLDDHESLGTWAGHCWRALLALDDYAELSASRTFRGSVATYLANVPAGCHAFSINRHAPFESSDVGNNPKYRLPRTLPVPAEVDHSGRIYMEAHFKIAKSATITPRLHYFDDTARTGKVFVGYIGRHLPSSMTN